MLLNGKNIGKYCRIFGKSTVNEVFFNGNVKTIKGGFASKPCLFIAMRFLFDVSWQLGNVVIQQK
jgi:hypothetical protein